MECACSPFQEGERRNDVQLLGPMVHKQSSLSNTHFTLGSNAIACPVLLLTLRQIPFTNLGARKYSNGLDSPCGRKHMRKNRVRKREHPKILTGGTGQNLRAGCLAPLNTRALAAGRPKRLPTRPITYHYANGLS